ncbi:MAG: isoprenylcysteine carboxylmethyltransferase family protein [Candidatus Bathyarchaeota archaeon]|nr:isoprenylcysteine carboxylmethyltransferase family protein [Candidatus Bathyarchaeota archaeon]
MSLIPEFELGLWNAWILVLSLFLVVIGLSSLIIRVFFTKKKPAGSSRQHMPQLNEQEKRLFYVSVVTLVAILVYTAFLPLKLGTGWFYAGLLIYFLGMIFGFIAMINFNTTLLDKPVIDGVYRISRNPMYFSMFLMFIGIGIACAFWVFLLLTMIWIILSDKGVIAEERECLEKYGEAYREYMNRTPRWIGIPKSDRRN